jgi:CubicO group peptidase (beta-lactamase class C family)
MKTQKLERLGELATEMVETGYVAGVNCMVLQHGRELAYYEAGYRDVAGSKKMTRDTIFRLYSMTKPVTSAAAMILLEEGKIDLLDPVSKFLPGFQDQYVIEKGVKVPVTKPATIQNLLNMTSGLVYPGEGNPAEIRNTPLMEEIIAKLSTPEALKTVDIANRIGELPLAFMPGTTWQYGLSADVLGAVIEVVSGMSYGEFLKKRIFEPLGMQDTAFYVPAARQDRLAKVYRETEDGLVEEHFSHLGIQNTMEREPAFESGGAGLTSTIDDYARFTQMLLQKGEYQGKRILSPETVRFMTTAHVSAQQQKGVETWESLAGYTYGNLMRIMTSPESAGGLGSLGEYGWDGWLGTYMMNDPAHELTFLMMYQRTDSGTVGYSRKMRNVLFAALEE